MLEQQAPKAPPPFFHSLPQGQGGGNKMVRSQAPVLSGRIEPELVTRVVEQNLSRFGRCYRTGLQHTPSLRGEVTVRFVIGRDGSVVHAEIVKSEVPDPSVGACVLAAIRGISFPQPEAGIVTVEYPLVFSPD